MPTQMTPAQARIVDPVLSNHATAYRQPGLVGNTLFPIVNVGQRAGKRIAFGREDFIIYSSGRAPGANTKRVNVGYSGEAYALTDHSLEGVLPIELMQEAQAVPGIDLGRRALNVPLRSLALELEVAQASAATDANNYDSNHKTSLTSGDRWDTSTGLPTTDIKAAKEAVRQSIGVDPNTVVIPKQTFNAVCENGNIIDRFKYTSSDSITPEMLAKLWMVDRVVVAGGVKWDGNSTDMTDIWGKSVIVAYVPQSPLGMEEPSYGYTYRLTGYPIAEQPYFERNPKSWIYPVTDARAPVLTSMLAGYLIQTPIS